MENLDYYNKSMSRTLIDKMFFLPHVDATLFVDYGCGDGSLIEACSYFKPESIYCGYDNNPKQLELARNKYISGINIFLKDLNNVKNFISMYPERKSCLILSSVIHEVYSYQPKEEIEKFWDFVTNTGFDYIAIRDMYPIDYENSSRFIYSIQQNKEYINKLNQFEEVWGNIRNEYNLQHFILKYYQTENWERELRENYLPLEYWRIFRKFCNSKYDYEVMYEHKYILPFLYKKVKKDFGFSLYHPTHYQLLIEK